MNIQIFGDPEAETPRGVLLASYTLHVAVVLAWKSPDILERLTELARALPVPRSEVGFLR